MAGGGPTPSPTPTAPAKPLSCTAPPSAGAAPPPMEVPAASPVGPPPPPPPPLKGSSLPLPTPSRPFEPVIPCAGEAQPPTGAAAAPARTPSAACEPPPVPTPPNMSVHHVSSPSLPPARMPLLERSGPTPAPIPPEVPVSSPAAECHRPPTAMPAPSSTASSAAPFPAPANPTVAPAPRTPAPVFSPANSPSSSNCTCAAATSPAPAPARSTLASGFEKYGLSITGSAVSCALMLLPFLHLLFKSGGNLESTMTLWKVGGIEVGLANSLLWLLYSVVVLPRDNAYDTILVNAWSAAVNLSLLLVMYARKQTKTRAKFSLGGTLIVIIACLFVFQKPVRSNVYTELGFGGAGLAALLGTHWLQIIDLWNSTEQRELIPPFVTILPNIVLAGVQCVICFMLHRKQLIIMMSAYLNIAGYAVELTLMWHLHILIKQRSMLVFRKLKRMNAFRKASIAGDIESQFCKDEDDECLYEEAMLAVPRTAAGGDNQSVELDEFPNSVPQLPQSSQHFEVHQEETVPAEDAKHPVTAEGGDHRHVEPDECPKSLPQLTLYSEHSQAHEGEIVPWED